VIIWESTNPCRQIQAEYTDQKNINNYFLGGGKVPKIGEEPPLIPPPLEVGGSGDVGTLGSFGCRPHSLEEKGGSAVNTTLGSWER